MGSGASNTKVEEISIKSPSQLKLPGVGDPQDNWTLNNNYASGITKGDNLNSSHHQSQVNHPTVCVNGVQEDNLSPTSHLQKDKRVQIKSKMASKDESEIKKELNEDSDDDNDSENEGEDNPEGTTTKKKVPKTLEEYKELEINHLEKAKTFLESLEAYKEDADDDKLQCTLVSIKKMYLKLISAPLALRVEYRHKLARIIVDHGVYVPLICDKIVRILKEGKFRKSKEDEIGTKNYKFVSVNIIALMNFSDCSDLFREALGNHEPLLMVMSEKLLEWADVHLDKSIP
ncbi:hypothetical protein LOTGIDRAFT_235663, partial [Lottia gigantea]